MSRGKTYIRDIGCVIFISGYTLQHHVSDTTVPLLSDTTVGYEFNYSLLPYVPRFDFLSFARKIESQMSCLEEKTTAVA